jgi:DNA repair protein RadA/Sms
MGKSVWVCNECGYESAGYLGQCTYCKSWGTFEEQKLEKASKSAKKNKHKLFVEAEDKVQTLNQININEIKRTDSGSLEFDRVLGGGIVPASLVLVGGHPGIGKSTLLLQVANHFNQKSAGVLYVSAEESSSQLKMRAKRLKVDTEKLDNIYVYTENNLEKIINQVHSLKLELIIIDSIQAIYNPHLDSIPGTVSQVRECCSSLMRLAKSSGVPILIVGHINKDGDIAGPKILEHMVDAVLQFESVKDQNIRILRAIKNRFGNTDELGVFNMVETGLEDVKDPSEIFLDQRSGGIVVATREGRRSLLVEIQSLAIKTEYNNPRRLANGIDLNRLHQIIAILQKHLKLTLYKSDIYLNVVGGLTIKEPAVDLGIALSIFVNALELENICEDLLVIGELGLNGEVRYANQLEIRIKEGIKLGFKHIMLPQQNFTKLDCDKFDATLIPVSSIKQAAYLLQNTLVKKPKVGASA